MKVFRSLTIASFLGTVSLGFAQRGTQTSNELLKPSVGTWQRTANRINGDSGLPLLLTDGTVMIHNPMTREWYKLTPDAFGNYQTGTWSQLPSLPSGYGPLYFGTAVLRDGRVVICGGEYNLTSQVVYSNKCAYYNPLTNAWTMLAPPSGWDNIGDTQLSVMPDGKVIIAELYDKRMAILDPVSMTWTNLAATGKADRHHEEGWTLLPDGTLLTLDTIAAPNGEKYVPSLDAWFPAGATPQSLIDLGSHEVGPAILLPSGTVFCTGATGHNAIYHPGAQPTDPGTWTAAPDFPNIGGQLDIADGPACLLPNGNVLCATSPGIYANPTHFFEYDGTSMLTVPSNPHAGNNPSYVGNMVMLPTGQVLYTDLTNDVEIYTPTGTFQEAWRPVITNCPTTINQGMSFVLDGKQLNGLSECSSYGDDSTNATNYPLVRVKNTATGHVKYCRTRDHSIMAVATGDLPVSTNVDVPATLEVGPSMLEVVTNGIPSLAKPVNIVAPGVVLPTSYAIVRGKAISGVIDNLFYADSNSLKVGIGLVLNASEAPVQLQGTSVSPKSNPTTFQLTLTSMASTAGLVQTIQLFNFVTNAYEVLDSRSATTSMQTVTVTASGDLTRFIKPGTSEVRALTTYAQTGPVSQGNWNISTDLFNWVIK